MFCRKRDKMKKAVILIAHKNPSQINIFLEQLIADGSTDVYIHINKINEDILPCIIDNQHIFIYKNNRVVTWGSDDIIQIIMSMLNEIIVKTDHYEYILIRTGQDLLVRGGLDAFLEEHNGQVFIDCFDYEKNSNLCRARLLYKWPKIFRRMYNNKYNLIRIARGVRIRLLGKGFPGVKKHISKDISDMKIYHDLWWCCIPRDIAVFLNKMWIDNKYIREMYLDSLIPEECFFSTMIMNSAYKDRIKFVNNESETISYKYTQVNNHPPILKMNDIDKIESQGCFFARKFDKDIDSDIIDYFSDKIKRYYTLEDN